MKWFTWIGIENVGPNGQVYEGCQDMGESDRHPSSAQCAPGAVLKLNIKTTLGQMFGPVIEMMCWRYDRHGWSWRILWDPDRCPVCRDATLDQDADSVSLTHKQELVLSTGMQTAPPPNPPDRTCSRMRVAPCMIIIRIATDQLIILS